MPSGDLPGAGFCRIVQAQAPYPLPDGEIISLPVPDIVAQTIQDVKSFDCGAVIVVPIAECQALVDLYESTNGAGWQHPENWLENMDISVWHGVTVADNHVTELIMSKNNMVGTLPDR